MDYLHWIGKSNYTMNSFAKEAAKYGVTRRVSLNIAKQMSWSDKVYCAMLDGKTGVIFGYFIVDKLSGLSTEVTTQLEDKYETKLVGESGELVVRGCGEYIEGSTHAVRCELPDIIDMLASAEKEGVDIGKPMIGGLFVTITKIRLLDIPFRPGFRIIDEIALLISSTGNSNKVRGQFYINDNSLKRPTPDYLKECGWVQAVEDYKQSKRIKPRTTQKTLKKKE